MYHLRLKGAHYDMGVKRGSIFNKCGIRFPLHMDEFQVKHGTESEALLREFFPEVCREIRGVTDTIGNDYSELMSWMLAMGCCMYNLERNHPVEIRGCTAFAVKTADTVLYGRNNDLPPFLKYGSKSELYAPEGGYRFIINTSSFTNGEEGMNDRGLVVAMTFVLTDLSDIAPGFNSVFTVRYLLEKAADTKEALEMFSEIPIASNYNIILADKNGDLAVAECSPKKINLRRPVRLSNGIEIVCTVNDFTSDEMKSLESYDETTYRSGERYETVMNAFGKYNGEGLDEFVTGLLRGERGFICQYPKSDCFETIWSSVFRPDTLKILRAEGDPRKKAFISDKRLEKLDMSGTLINNILKKDNIQRINANKYLFGPIGVSLHRNYMAITAEEHKKFMLSKEPKEHLRFADPQGVGTAGYGLCLSAQDMAKIGQLCLSITL